ncbi:hypothetical protein GQ457_17G009670 [Hibiscus cannabinus]
MFRIILDDPWMICWCVAAQNCAFLVSSTGTSMVVSVPIPLWNLCTVIAILVSVRYAFGIDTYILVPVRIDISIGTVIRVSVLFDTGIGTILRVSVLDAWNQRMESFEA